MAQAAPPAIEPCFGRACRVTGLLAQRDHSRPQVRVTVTFGALRLELSIEARRHSGCFKRLLFNRFRKKATRRTRPNKEEVESQIPRLVSGLPSGSEEGVVRLLLGYCRHRPVTGT